MERRIRISESELTRLIRRVISEQQINTGTGMYPSTGARVPSTGARVPSTGDRVPSTGDRQQNLVSINPKIQIDCNKRVILNSQLPKLDKTANYVIINHYCNKQ